MTDESKKIPAIGAKTVNKMNKKIKFALILKNGEKVRTLSDLKKFFDIREIIECFLDGKLERWLSDHYYHDYAAVVSNLRRNYKIENAKNNSEKISISDIVEQLHKIFEIPITEESKLTDEEVEYIRELSVKEDGLNQIIDDKDALNNIATVARNQKELRKIIKKNQKNLVSIYLLNDGEDFYFLDVSEDIETTKLRFVGVDTKGEKQGTPTKIKLIFNFSEDDFEDERKAVAEKFFEDFRYRFSDVKIFAEINDAGNFIEQDFPKIEAEGFYTVKRDTENSVEAVQDKLIRYMDAGFPLIYINTFEEDKVDDIIEEAASERTFFEWNAEEFFGKRKGAAPEKISREGWSLKNSLKHLIRIQEVDRAQKDSSGKILNLKYNLERSVLVLKDAHNYLRDDEVIAHLKHLSHLIYSGQLEDCNILIVSPVLIIPKELENYLTIIRLGNLTEGEIKNLVLEFCKNHETNLPDDKFCDDLTAALKGLSEFDIVNILSLALSGDNELKRSDIKLILDQKKQMIQKTNVLEMIDIKEGLEDIGGLENLKNWLRRKAKIFGDIQAAKDFGVQIPKGILIVGMPGCGKSLSAKATAKTFEMPLLKMDMGRIMGKYVGESEANMRRALQLSEAIAPCVLWIDELEKAFSGIGSGGGSAEVTTRLFGTFLTWLQEKKQAVFVVATANDVSSLPPELLRKGRFDEIFYIGLPNTGERRKIFEIYIRKLRGQDYEILERHIDKFVEVTRNYSGADIEGVVREAVELAFIQNFDEGLTPEYLEKAIEETYSISQAQSNVIDDLKSKKFKNASAEDTGDTIYKTFGYHFNRMKRNFSAIWKAIKNRGPKLDRENEEPILKKVKKILRRKFAGKVSLKKRKKSSEEKINEQP